MPRTSFYPVPDVDGAIVILEPRAPPFEVLDEKLFFKVVDCIYSHRRKKIGNCFVENHRWFNKSRKEMREMAKHIPFRDKRAEQLEPEEMAELANRLSEKLI